MGWMMMAVVPPGMMTESKTYFITSLRFVSRVGHHGNDSPYGRGE
jgi:hypothetical protein